MSPSLGTGGRTADHAYLGWQGGLQVGKALFCPYAAVKRARVLDAEGLALGSVIATSKKAKRDLIDDSFNRYLQLWVLKGEQCFVSHHETGHGGGRCVIVGTSCPTHNSPESPLRYSFNEDEGELPEWFTEEEKQHRRKQIPVDRQTVEAYRQRWREINARPIKKVAEAKARKKRRVSGAMNLNGCSVSPPRCSVLPLIPLVPHPRCPHRC